VAREAVGPDPADQHEDHERDGLRGEDIPEVRLRSGQVEDGERERDDRERVAGDRDRPAEEEKPELPLAERLK